MNTGQGEWIPFVARYRNSTNINNSECFTSQSNLEGLTKYSALNLSANHSLERNDNQINSIDNCRQHTLRLVPFTPQSDEIDSYHLSHPARCRTAATVISHTRSAYPCLICLLPRPHCTSKPLAACLPSNASHPPAALLGFPHCVLSGLHHHISTAPSPRRNVHRLLRSFQQSSNASQHNPCRTCPCSTHCSHQRSFRFPVVRYQQVSPDAVRALQRPAVEVPSQGQLRLTTSFR